MAKLLLLSDLHAHPFRYGSRENGRDRANDALSCLDQATEIAERQRVDAVLIPGDLTHVKGRVDTVTMSGLYDRFDHLRSRKLRTVVIPGNHDQGDMEGRHHAARTLRDVATVLDQPGALDLGAVVVAYVPWVEGGRADWMEAAYEAGEAAQAITGKPRVLMAHVGVAGATAGADYVFPGEEEPTGADLAQLRRDCELDAIFLGHFHQHQEVAPGVWVVGAPLQHNWGDVGQKRGVLVWDSETGTVQHLPLHAPRFVRARMDDLEFVAHTVDDCFVRLETSDAIGPAEKERLREGLRARYLEIVPARVDTEEERRFDAGAVVAGSSIEARIEAYAKRYVEDGGEAKRLGALGVDLYRAAVAEVEAEAA